MIYGQVSQYKAPAAQQILDTHGSYFVRAEVKSSLGSLEINTCV